MAIDPADERRHADAHVEEWLFATWTPGGRHGALSGYRISGRRAWYWAALVSDGHPLLHVAEWDVALRADPMIVKADSLWAEHVCDAVFEQWTIGNETYAAALDDADEGLGRAYGTPTPVAFDLEWYAVAAPVEIADGYEQAGVVHGTVEVAGRPPFELVEAPAHRWHRWTRSQHLAPVQLPSAVAHTGRRVAFRFPDGGVSDWVLTPEGWRSRDRRPAPAR